MACVNEGVVPLWELSGSGRLREADGLRSESVAALEEVVNMSGGFFEMMPQGLTLL